MMQIQDLVKIRNMLEQIVNYMDKNVINLDSDCLHTENVVEISTMGISNRKFKCLDCQKIWEEEFENTQLNTLGN